MYPAVHFTGIRTYSLSLFATCTTMCVLCVCFVHTLIYVQTCTIASLFFTIHSTASNCFLSRTQSSLSLSLSLTCPIGHFTTLVDSRKGPMLISVTGVKYSPSNSPRSRLSNSDLKCSYTDIQCNIVPHSVHMST